MEIFAYAQGLPQLKQLEYFSLKVLQNPNISEECIERFAGVISKLDNLSNFDLYFRKYKNLILYWVLIISFRLSLPPRGILELGKRIESLSNLQCSCGKESIHIFKQKANASWMIVDFKLCSEYFLSFCHWFSNPILTLCLCLILLIP